MNRRTLSRLVAVLAIVALLLPAAALTASADAISLDMESYTDGNINGQDGWSKTGTFDVAVEINTYGFAAFGAKTLRISDAVTSGSFGDQLFAKPLVNAVGETAATADGFSVGVRQNHFEMQFDIASTQAAQQPGMHVSVSPDRGDGSRMSYLRFEDDTAGIDVFFDDVPQSAACTPSGCANFVETQVANDLSRATAHTIKLTMDTLDGPANDVVKVYIDSALVKTGTSWEGYYRFDPEAAAEQSTRIVKTVLFRVSGTATPANSGKGYLFDNLSMTSGGTLPVTPGDPSWIFYNDGFPGGTGELVIGPATPPLGVGSAHFVLPGTSRMNYGTRAYKGMRLADITKLEYSTYRASADPINVLAVALQFDFDVDVTDANIPWQGRLVYEPYMSVGNTIAQNVWQTWNPLAGKWWWSKGDPTHCDQDHPCTWSEVLTKWPNAGIISDANNGFVWLRAGGPWTGFDGNADALTIGVNGANTTYDFEPAAIKPTTGAPTFCVGKNTTVDVRIEGVSNLYGYQLDVNYDAAKASAVGAFDNSWFDTTVNAAIPTGYAAACASGVCKFGAAKLNPGVAVSGSGRIGTITLTGVAAGTFDVTISGDVLSDRDGMALTHTNVTLPLTVCGYADVSGKISLQGRLTPIDSGTITLTDNGGMFAPKTGTFSASDGTWNIANVEVAPAGSTYTLQADHGLYLFNEKPLPLTVGATAANQNTRLLGGDANNDETVSIADLGCIGGAFGTGSTCGGLGSTDINKDTLTNVQDLSIAGGNYNKSSPQLW